MPVQLLLIGGYMNHLPISIAEAEDFLSRAQVAELFCVSPSTVTRWADAGKITCVRTLGGHRRYQKESIVKLVRSLMQQEESVESITWEISQMYGDHHVSTVQRIVSQMAGVQEVWASSGLRRVTVSFDPEQVTAEAIRAQLAEAGYSPDSESRSSSPLAAKKDPAWAKNILRMTQTYSIAA